MTCIPPGSRLAEAIRFVLDRHAGGDSWESTRAAIEERFGHYSWVHTINNAALVVAGLLWGDGDSPPASGSLSKAAGTPTPTAPPRAASAGIISGAKRLPDHWVEPLHDTARSAIRGFDRSPISDLADRTVRLAVGT